MLAGLGPAPAVLLVVAADEGWREQSTEHLAAIDALGIEHGLVAVTRSDLADPSAALAEARQRAAASSLGDVEAVAVSGRTGDGLPQLRAALSRLVDRMPEPDHDRPGAALGRPLVHRPWQRHRRHRHARHRPARGGGRARGRRSPGTSARAAARWAAGRCGTGRCAGGREPARSGARLGRPRGRAVHPGGLAPHVAGRCPAQRRGGRAAAPAAAARRNGGAAGSGACPRWPDRATRPSAAGAAPGGGSGHPARSGRAGVWSLPCSSSTRTRRR